MGSLSHRRPVGFGQQANYDLFVGSVTGEAATVVVERDLVVDARDRERLRRPGPAVGGQRGQEMMQSLERVPTLGPQPEGAAEQVIR